MNRNHERLKSFISILASVILLTFSFPVYANETVQVDVSNSPIVDIYLAKGISKVETKTFKKDLLSQIQNDGYNTDQMQVNEVQSAEVNVSTAFNWQKDVSSSIGSINITGSGRNVDMYGNESNEGKNAIWTFPSNDFQQKFTFGYNIDFGDSFNAGGMLLKVTRSGSTLTGYMISFNNSKWVSAADGAKGAVWRFNYGIGENSTNMTKTLIKSLAINQSGTLTVESGKDSIAVSGGGLSGTEIIKTDVGCGNGFGFFSDHYSHGCERIGQFSLTNINLTQTNVKTITDVLKTPEWRDNSTRMLCNVNDYAESDFQSANDLSQTLMRTINENIHYISWGNSENKSSNTSFITKNNQKGVFIDSGNYSNAIKQTANYIEQVIDSYQSKQYVAVEEPIKLQIMPSSLSSNTSTSDFPNGRWKIDHEYTYFANDMGKYVNSGIYQKDIPKTFDKVGKYSIYFADDLVKEVFVHRMPVASFSTIIKGTDITYRTNSMDMDSIKDTGYGPGIIIEEWSYRESSSSAWSKGKLTTYNPSKVYLVQLRVKDDQGAWSKPVVKYLSSSSNTPLADFSFGANTITEYDKLNIIDNSYDPSGKALTAYQWVLKKGNEIISTTSKPITDFNVKNLGIGTYTYTLKVTNSAGVQSDEFTRRFEVIKYVDTISPTIDIVRFTSGKDPSVIIQMSDNIHGTGVKGVHVNGTFQAGNPVLITVPDKVAVLRLQAEDQAGNKSAVRRELVPDRTVIAIKSITFSDDNKTATITAVINDSETSVRGVYCNGELIEGNPVTYKIPIENSQYLKVQAVSNEDDRSELVTKRVPGWSEVTGDIAITSVEFLSNYSRVRVRADTTRKSSITGIYVNKEFYAGNPIECPILSNKVVCQAVDEYGDLSQPVVRQVPAAPQSTGRSRGEKGGGTGSTTSITISNPVLQEDGQYRIDISAKDSECDIEKIVAVYDGRKEDVTKSHFLLLDDDTLLQVIAKNDEGRMTYKKVHIRLEKEPVVEELEEKEVPISGKSKRTTKPNSHCGYSAPTGGASQLSENNTQDDKKERLAQLLQQQRLKQYEDQPVPKVETNPEISETICRTSASNHPGVAAVAASVLCFLALMAMVILLVVRQQKASAYCKQVGTAKKG